MAVAVCVACGLKDAPYYDRNGLCPLCLSEQEPPAGTEIMQNRAVDSSTTTTLNNLPSASSELQRRARTAIEEHGGLRPAATALSKKVGFRVNHGIVGLAAAGHDFPKAREVFDLPPRSVAVPPCPHCGEVHTVGWCVKEEGEPKKPRNGNRRRTRRPPRLQIRKDDPASAAASIRRNLPEEIVKRLKELL